MEEGRTGKDGGEEEGEGGGVAVDAKFGVCTKTRYAGYVGSQICVLCGRKRKPIATGPKHTYVAAGILQAELSASSFLATTKAAQSGLNLSPLRPESLKMNFMFPFWATTTLAHRSLSGSSFLHSNVASPICSIMPPKKRSKLTQGKRRRRTVVPPRPADEAARLQQGHEAGAALLKRLLIMFSVCKLDAADLCICCYHLALMDAPGADWRLYAYPPDRHASIYQTHLDTVLPPVGPFYHVDTPIWSKGGERVTKSIPTACLWQRLRREFEANSDLAQTLECSSDATPDVMKTAAYKSHPKVKASIDNDDPLPLPLAIYLDAVAFSSALAGRSDSILGLWVINLISDKRHMFCVVRLLDMCRCGCKGWCTLFPLLFTLQWELIALQSGAPPLCRHDLSAWDLGDAMGDMEFFSFICVLIWIKGDWAEFAHTPLPCNHGRLFSTRVFVAKRQKRRCIHCTGMCPWIHYRLSPGFLATTRDRVPSAKCW